MARSVAKLNQKKQELENQLQRLKEQIKLARKKKLSLYETIGQNIQDCRKELNLNQSEFADKVGLSRASIVNIEAGRQKITIEMLYKFAAILNKTIFELLPENL